MATGRHPDGARRSYRRAPVGCRERGETFSRAQETMIEGVNPTLAFPLRKWTLSATSSSTPPRPISLPSSTPSPSSSSTTPTPTPNGSPNGSQTPVRPFPRPSPHRCTPSSFNVPPLEGTWSICSPFRRLPPVASQVCPHLCIGRDPRHIDMAYTRSPARSSPPHPRSIPLPSSADHRSVRSPNGLSQTRVPPFLAMLPQRRASTRGRTSAPPSQIHSRSLHPHRSFSPPIPRSRRSRWRFNTKLCMSKPPFSIQSQKKIDIISRI